MSALPPVLATKAGAAIREHRLANGLGVLIVERHLDPVVAVMLWYRVGSRDERERDAGVSHFLEHMMFKGSAGFAKGEIDRVTTLLGGTNNAFTSNDHTAYWFELASDRWEAALEIEADRMRALLLDPAEYTAEKAVVLEELSMGQDDPWRRLVEAVQETVFGRHPYRRPIIGYPDALRRMPVEEMRAHYQRHYRPDNALLVVCGDVDPERALARAEELFGSIAPPPLAAEEPFRPEVAEPRGERRLALRWDDAGQRLCVAWPGAKVGSEDDWTLDLIATVLTGGRLSRLHRRLVLERALATSVSTQNDARVEAGAFWLFAECAQGVAPGVLEAAVDAEIERLRHELVPARELERAKRVVAAGEAYESETVTDLAEEIGEFAIDGDWRLALVGVERIRAITPAALRECARRLLAPERRVVGWSLPQAQKARARAARASKPPAKKRRAKKRAAKTPRRRKSPARQARR